MSKVVWIINQYASTPATGMGGRHFYLAKELVKKGYKVYIIASSSHHLLRNKPVFNQAFQLEVIDGINFVWVKLPSYAESRSKQRVINWFLFPWQILKLPTLIQDKPDAILCSSPSPFSFLGGQRLARRFGVRLVFEVRDIWPLSLTEIDGYSPGHPFIRLMQWVEDRAYQCSDFVISNLKYSFKHMISRGMKPEKFTWIPNGFSQDEVDQKILLNSQAQKQLPNKPFVVGYTGTLGVANTLKTLIDAADRLHEYSDIAFVLVGSGREKAKLEQAVSDKKLSNVFFIDPIPKDEIQAMLTQFDVCYIGLTNDPLFRFGVSPNKFFDYLYSGKAIIYGIDSGEYKPVEEMKAGLQVPAEDAEKLAEAILKIYCMPPEIRKQMGENGRKGVEPYEYGKLAQQLSNILFDK